MDSTLRVSGDSPILKRLMSSCDEVTPWLALNGDNISIDWDLALRRWSETRRKDSLPAGLRDVLKLLLPVLPLPSINKLQGPEWRMRHMDSSVHSRLCGQPFVVPPRGIDSLNAVSSSVNTLIDVINVGLSRKGLDNWARFKLEEARSSLIEIRSACGTRYLRQDWLIRYRLEQRMAVARGKMAMFLKGTSAYYSIDRGERIRKHRVECWALARRLIRAHAAFFSRLEELMTGDLASLAFSDSAPEFKEAWLSLGQLEQTLVRSLAAPPHLFGHDVEATFTDLVPEFLGFVDENEANLPSSDSTPASFCSDSSKAMPLGSLIHQLRQWPAFFETLSRVLPQERNKMLFESEKAVFAEALSALTELNREMIGRSLNQLRAQEVDHAIDWLVSASPLLTLVFSGFLAVFSPASESGRFVTGLSPWAAATIIAQKHLGTLPLTYLGVDPSTDDGSDDDNTTRTGAAAAHDKTLTGKQLWDLFRVGSC